MIFSNKLYEMLQICLLRILLMIWINWKFIKKNKKIKNKEDGWRVFILST